MTQPSQVIDDTENARLTVGTGGAVAEITYRLRAGRLILVHTRVPDELSGHGVGGQLVQAALAKAAAGNLTLVPLCPFARGWLRRHPDAAAGVTVDWTEPPG
jgi:uncharacterized protein